MKEIYHYRSARKKQQLTFKEICSIIEQFPLEEHQLWKSGWSSWKNWHEVKVFRPLKTKLALDFFHYIGPTGRDLLSLKQITSNILLSPKSNHRILTKGWDTWKHWYELEALQITLVDLIPKSQKTIKIIPPQKSVLQPSSKDSSYNVLTPTTPSQRFNNAWNFIEQHWILIAQEDLLTILDELQNSFPNLTWRPNWISEVIAWFWIAIFDSCYGAHNDNGELGNALEQSGKFCLPKVCTFYPADPVYEQKALHIKTSNGLQDFFGQQKRLSLGDQSPFRNTRIWSGIFKFHGTKQSLSRRRRLCWLIHQYSGLALLSVTQIISTYEHYLLEQLKENYIFELGDIGRLILRKAHTKYHIELIPTQEILQLTASSIKE